jgi:hypothetical protein
LPCHGRAIETGLCHLPVTHRATMLEMLGGVAGLFYEGALDDIMARLRGDA